MLVCQNYKMYVGSGLNTMVVQIRKS